jgi:hypothetical protein
LTTGSQGQRFGSSLLTNADLAMDCTHGGHPPQGDYSRLIAHREGDARNRRATSTSLHAALARVSTPIDNR